MVRDRIPFASAYKYSAVELVLLDNRGAAGVPGARVVRFCAPVGIIIGVVAMSRFAVLRGAAVGAARTEAQSGATLVLTALGLVAQLDIPAADQAVAVAVGIVVGSIGVVLVARHEARIASAAVAFAGRFRR